MYLWLYAACNSVQVLLDKQLVLPAPELPFPWELCGDVVFRRPNLQVPLDELLASPPTAASVRPPALWGRAAAVAPPPMVAAPAPAKAGLRERFSAAGLSVTLDDRCWHLGHTPVCGLPASV